MFVRPVDFLWNTVNVVNEDEWCPGRPGCFGHLRLGGCVCNRSTPQPHPASWGIGPVCTAHSLPLRRRLTAEHPYLRAATRHCPDAPVWMKTYTVNVLLPAWTQCVATCLKAAVLHFPASQVRGTGFTQTWAGHDEVHSTRVGSSHLFF